MLFLVALVLRLGPSIGDLPHIYDYDEPLFMTFEVGRMYSEHSLEPSGYAPEDPGRSRSATAK